MTLEFHPLANIFPLIEGTEFGDLVASVKANGLRDTIVLHDGQILDGRNRYRACLTAEIDARFEPLPADADPLSFVIDKNLKRRHLNDDQRRMVAARLANLDRGRPAENAAECGISRGAAAKMLAVDESGVERAKTVIAKAEPEVRAAVDRGKLTVAAAAQAAKLSPTLQRQVAEEAEAGNANVARSVIKRETRSAREVDLAKKQCTLPTRKFGVIVADPEWQFEPWSRATGMDRAADNHYPTSCTEVIAARDVASIAADDCVLFLWATAPMLPHALTVMAAWGFDYRSHLVWYKNKKGTGYWFRNCHELLLVGVRGSVPAPAPGTQPPSVLTPPVGAHSAKPECFLELIEFYYPTLPKIELNRRGPARSGWSAWGNEST